MIHRIEDIFYSGPHPISQPLFPSQYLTNRVIKLDRGMSYFYPAEGLNPSDENSALVHYIQVIALVKEEWFINLVIYAGLYLTFWNLRKGDNDIVTH